MIGAIVDTLGEMGIKVYISGNSGNKEIVTHQQRIFMILKSLAIEFEPVDIAGPGMDNQKDEMRAKGKKKEGQRHALPPQIFNGEKYCGDYDDFDLANEDDELEEFLGIPRKTPKSNPETKQNGHVDGQEAAAAATTNGEVKPADADPSGEQTAAAAESAPAAPSETSPPSGDKAAAAPSSGEAPTSEPAAAGDGPAAETDGGGGGEEDDEEGEGEEEEGEDYEYEEGEDEA